MTSEEITKAVFKMKLNKAPGLDGLNVEFYRKFWTQIQKILTKVYNESNKKKSLTNSQKKGAISLIFKKERSKISG